MHRTFAANLSCLLFHSLEQNEQVNSTGGPWQSWRLRNACGHPRSHVYVCFGYISAVLTASGFKLVKYSDHF